MRGQTAKKLRKRAREMTIGAPARGLVELKSGKVNATNATRGVYRSLKKAFKKGRIA